MEYISIQKYISKSPRKVRLVADMVKRMQPSQALDVLQFTNKGTAPILAKAIKTALANAKVSNVVFKSIEINEGPRLKRYHVGTAGRGRGRPFKRRLSHIRIVLTDDLSVRSPKSKIKKSTQTVKMEQPLQTNEHLVENAAKTGTVVAAELGREGDVVEVKKEPKTKKIKKEETTSR